MTQLALPDKPESATDRVARLFVAHRGCWLTMPEIVAEGGLGSWRTEISRCRQQYQMQFSNRITRSPSGKVLSSEYRLVDAGTWPHRAGKRAA